MKRNVGYLRVATHMQLDGESALDGQRQAVRIAAEDMGVDIEEWVSDIPASGWGDVPHGLAGILRAAERGEIGQVWVLSLDRLSRRPEMLSELLAAFESAGVDLRRAR